MPLGPDLQNRPADVVASAALVGRIVIREADDIHGLNGDKARAESVDADRCRLIAKKSANAHWG